MACHLGDGARQGKSIRIEKKQVLAGRYSGPNVGRRPKANVFTDTDQVHVTIGTKIICALITRSVIDDDYLKFVRKAFKIKDRFSQKSARIVVNKNY